MNTKAKYLFAPLVMMLFAAIPGGMAVQSLRVGALWRGGGHEPVITLAKDAQGFYGGILFLSMLALIFLATAVAFVVIIIHHKTK